MNQKPELSFWQIWNMCFGFLGIQFGFALQNANVSRIFQTLGADIDDIPILWIAAPLTGLSGAADRRLLLGSHLEPAGSASAVLPGRRDPDHAGVVRSCRTRRSLWIAAGLLWILDASINVSMEPFRAFVGDQLPPQQRAAGYAMQSFFIGIGAVVASMLPWLLTKAGVANTARSRRDSRTRSSTRSMPAACVLFAGGRLDGAAYPRVPARATARLRRCAAGRARALAPDRAQGGLAIVRCLVWPGRCCADLVLRRARQAAVHARRRIAGLRHRAAGLPGDAPRWRCSPRSWATCTTCPTRCGGSRWCSSSRWFALFAMWIYTTPAVTSVHFGSTDATSGRLQRRRQLGRCAVRRLQRLSPRWPRW